uniref:Uncharacterized protein n=1 Tax=Meloidogyne floridensis TaxID=298350 RepID=A0A915NN27_9BILA
MLETNDSKNSRELFDKINIKLQIIQEPLINFEDQIKQLAKEHYKIIEIIKDKYEGFREIIEEATPDSMIIQKLNETEYDKIPKNLSKKETNNTKVYINDKSESHKIECQNPLNGKPLDNDYIKLFFDYKIKGSEWDNLYWRITVDLIEQKLCDVDDNLYKDFETMDSEERDKLTLEESIYSRIYDYVLINKENTIAKLSSYNGGFDVPPLNELQETDQKVLDNSKLTINDCMRITILHLNAIKQLIEDEFDFDLKDNQSESSSSSASANILRKSQLMSSLVNMNKNKLFPLTKSRMRKVLGDFLLEELEINHPVLFKIGLLKIPEDYRKTVNNIIKNSNAFEIDEFTGKKLNIKSIQKLILFCKDVLNIQDRKKFEKFFSNYDNSGIYEIRALFSSHHANLLIKIKNQNRLIYEEFLKFLQKTIGAKTRLRQLLFGIEVGKVNKGDPLLDPPKYTNEYSELIPLVDCDLNQAEILEKLADYYIQGLTNLDEEANLKIFYSASILAQTYREDEIQENLNKNYEKELKNQKDAPNYWNLCKKTIFGRVDSFIDKDLEYCTYIGNGELNYLYYLRNLHSNNNIDENFKGMIDSDMFKKSDELTNINEQIDMIRTSHRYIFATIIDRNSEFLNKYEKIEQQRDI